MCLPSTGILPSYWKLYLSKSALPHSQMHSSHQHNATSTSTIDLTIPLIVSRVHHKCTTRTSREHHESTKGSTLRAPREHQRDQPRQRERTRIKGNREGQRESDQTQRLENRPTRQSRGQHEQTEGQRIDTDALQRQLKRRRMNTHITRTTRRTRTSRRDALRSMHY